MYGPYLHPDPKKPSMNTQTYKHTHVFIRQHGKFRTMIKYSRLERNNFLSHLMILQDFLSTYLLMLQDC